MDDVETRDEELEMGESAENASEIPVGGASAALAVTGGQETGTMDNGTSQSHKNPFFPMIGFGLFKETMEKQMEQMGNTLSELERMERERIERTESAIDDMTRLTKASLSYGHQLLGEWRKMNIEAAKRAMNVMG